MIALKLKSWRTAGVAAAALGVAACGGEAGEAGGEQGGEAGGEAGVSGGEAGEGGAPQRTASGGEGGEAGEAGAASAYAGLSGNQLTALRIQHLRGFVMAAAAVNADNQPAEAAVLVQQGLLEVYDVAPDQFGDLNIDLIRAAADGSLNRAQMMQRIRAAEAEMYRAVAALSDIDHAVLVVRMVDIATGLYQGVVQADFVDPIEYQHSMGAALAARSALTQGQDVLQRSNLRAYSEAQAELNRFIELWPQTSAPETPSSYQQVLAQSSRVRLALSPFL